MISTCPNCRTSHDHCYEMRLPTEGINALVVQCPLCNLKYIKHFYPCVPSLPEYKVEDYDPENESLSLSEVKRLLPGSAIMITKFITKLYRIEYITETALYTTGGIFRFKEYDTLWKASIRIPYRKSIY